MPETLLPRKAYFLMGKKEKKFKGQDGSLPERQAEFSHPSRRC
jgi:hypothetical protein